MGGTTLMQSIRITSRRWILPAIIVFSCVGCDRWTKMIATERFKPLTPMSFFGDTLRIQYAENAGAFLGAGAGLSTAARFWILVVVNAVFLIVIGAVVVTKILNRWQMTGVALLLAGGIGNLIDRIFHQGLVIDFLNMGVGPVRTGIFNVADMAIMAGFALLILQRGDAEPTRVPSV